MFFSYLETSRSAPAGLDAFLDIVRHHTRKAATQKRPPTVGSGTGWPENAMESKYIFAGDDGADSAVMLRVAPCPANWEMSPLSQVWRPECFARYPGHFQPATQPL